MLKDRLLKKLSGSDEMDINMLKGFHGPDEATHQEILRRCQKAFRRDVISSSFWCIMSMVFIISHIVMYLGDKDNIFLVFIAIFSVTIAISISRLKRYGFDIIRKIRDRDYQVRDIRVGRMISRFVSQSGCPAVKVIDNRQNIYDYEFVLNRENRKVYEKDPDSVFTLIKIGEVYSLAYIQKE